MKPAKIKTTPVQWILSTLNFILHRLQRGSYSTDLSEEEKQFMWKFRSCLKSNPRALVKFIRSVHWEAEVEIEEAMKAVMEWESVDTCDALELLGPSFSHPFVRSYAVSQLQNAKPGSILMYLPQLVQALRYEKDVPARSAACKCGNIATFLYWYLKVETEASAQVDRSISVMYEGMMGKLNGALAEGNKRSRRSLLSIERQRKFVDALRLDVLKTKLAESNEFLDLKGLSLPVDPSVLIKNIQVESTLLYASNMMPMRLTFTTMKNQSYTTIFKRGDDLRQDQLVSQMIRLMDSLLKERNLDLRLTTYSVLATGVSEGFVQSSRQLRWRNSKTFKILYDRMAAPPLMLLKQS
uniref:PIK helical domain-containing protein n=1 Tax=Ditylenchus dipsaci TaxID=166011 RepID=A0A915CWQ4_9BILA